MILKNELQNIISGAGKSAKGTAIQAIARYIKQSKTTSTITQKEKFFKEQAAEAILTYTHNKNFFFTDLNKGRYLAEGAEQKVYLNEDGRCVTKLNDSIFYATWEDYFHSLLLHNYFFPATRYELIGFYYDAERLYAAVQQPYIIATEPANEEAIKELMLVNNFTNTKNSDYYNKKLGVIIEDLHDENVLTNNGVLFFVDTVFYLTEDFYIR